MLNPPFFLVPYIVTLVLVQKDLDRPGAWQVIFRRTKRARPPEREGPDFPAELA